MNSNSSLPKDQTRTSIVNGQENENKLDWLKARHYFSSPKRTYMNNKQNKHVFMIFFVWNTINIIPHSR